MFNNKTYSMTGFGLASDHFNWGSLVIEMRSVNSRFLELHFKMPDQWRGAEPVLRELLQQQLKRGKVEIRLSSKNTGDPNDSVELSSADLQKIVHWQSQVHSIFAAAKPLSVYEILKLAQTKNAVGSFSSANALQNDTALTEGLLNAELTQALIVTAQKSLTALIESRQREGAALCQTLIQGLTQLRAIVVPLAEQMPLWIAAQQQKLSDRLQLILSSEATNLLGFRENQTVSSAAKPSGARPAEGSATASDQQLAGKNVPESKLSALSSTEVSRDEIMLRVRQEIAALGLKADVAEELARLNAHIAEFERSLDAAGPHGKRLDFLIQELNREANTIGSKSMSLMSTHASLGLKQVIEQLREQVQNLE
jgi:uncharacterized protein (TIGR00255 family)